MACCVCLLMGIATSAALLTLGHILHTAAAIVTCCCCWCWHVQGDAADQPMLTSAGLLNLLAARQKALAGDRPGQQLVGQLLEAAAEPYFGILRQWLCWGVLEDPYNEFMVKVSCQILFEAHKTLLPVP